MLTLILLFIILFSNIYKIWSASEIVSEILKDYFLINYITFWKKKMIHNHT